MHERYNVKICNDYDDLPLGDKRKVLFFNTKGKIKNVSDKAVKKSKLSETEF